MVDLERGVALHKATNARAVAWEGAGGARACLFSDTPFIELRGITDTADHQASGDFAAHLALAMANIAALLVNWRTTAEVRT
ncbi:5'-methylthioadenosine/S-adenosylhomocysteine nucleosidase [Candidatus Gracilibacteria bacterium]|nr:5'-methylthioadenosine/S-adenosylhomocysteine nucleosidase [Candidatus Gracilibacteria bacterium]